MDALTAALRGFNGSVDAFTRQYPGRFDALILLKPVLAQREAEATIIVSFRELGEGVAGYAELPIANGHLAPRPRINFDCDVVARPSVPPTNVILHELMHGFGLGHANFIEVGGIRELMSEKGRPDDPIIYPSTLDLYALHLIWFEGYAGDAVELPPWLEYKMVLPTAAQAGAGELEKRVSFLEKEVQALNSTLISLGDDIKLISAALESLREDVRSLEGEKRRLEDELIKQKAAVEAHERRIGELASRASELEADVRACEARAARLQEQLLEERARLQSEIEKLEKDLEKLSERWVMALIALMVLTGISSASLALSLVKAGRSRGGA